MIEPTEPDHMQRDTHVMQPGDAAIEIDAGSVTHSFVALPAHIEVPPDKAAPMVRHFQAQCQPTLWAQVVSVSPALPAFALVLPGELDSAALLGGLNDIGALEGRTVVLNTATVSFDKGKTDTDIFVGFCHDDDHPRVVLPTTNGILPVGRGR